MNSHHQSTAGIRVASICGRLLFLTCLVGLSACATGPAYQRPDIAVPGQWQSAANAAYNAPNAPNAPNTPNTPSPTPWWGEFQDPTLNRLVSLAMDNNHDLQAAGHRITQARALAQMAGAARWPALEVNANTGREKPSRAAASARSNASVDANFEWDVWGKNRQQQDAAVGRVQSSVHSQQGLRLALQSEVAGTYFQLLSAGDRLALLADSLKNSEAVLQLLQTQHKAGAVSGLEVARQQGLVASLKAEVPALALQRQQARTALALLLGRAVQDLDSLNLALLSSASTHPQTSALSRVRLPTVAAGLPSTLLVRRPDIQQAEADLQAAHADLGTARAALFPSLQLSAAGGVASSGLRALLRSGNPVWSLAAGLTAPIFDGGRRRGQVMLAKARQDELLQNYQHSILLALRDVENSLTAVQRSAEQHQHHQEVLAQATTALRLTDVRFRHGAVDFGTVLDAQRTLLAARASQEASALSQYAAAVALYRALGG
jgi:outer membrane protein, multidrug efflux system